MGTQAVAERESRPAFYAAAPWRMARLVDAPPPSLHRLASLRYVVIGACLAPHTDALRLAGTVLAFFFAVGVAAHALDEVHGHPLRTRIPDRARSGWQPPPGSSVRSSWA